MAVRKEFGKAAAAHRSAVELVEQAQVLAGDAAALLPDRQRDLITQLAQAGTVITPGWLGRALSRAADDQPLGEAGGDEPLCIRIGECVAAPNARFPVVVNLLGTGHLACNLTATDERVMSIVQTAALRLLAARPADSLSVSFVDFTRSNCFASFAPLIDAGLAPPIARDHASFTQVMDAAQAQLDHAQNRSRNPADLPERLLVVAGLPEEATAVARVGNLARVAARARLHLVVAGWRGQSLPDTTYVAVTAKGVGVAGVPLPVTVDPPPAPELIRRVCEELAASQRWLIGDESP